MFLLCGGVFAQIDSVINFKTNYIFSVEYVNADSTESEIKEAKILSLSDFGLRVNFSQEGIEYSKNLELKNLRKIGYKTGNNGWKYAGYGFVGTACASILVTQLFGKAITKGYDSDQAGFGVLLVAITAPFVGGLIGLLIGSGIDDYKSSDLTSYDKDLKSKLERVKMIISESNRINR